MGYEPSSLISLSFYKKFIKFGVKIMKINKFIYKFKKIYILVYDAHKFLKLLEIV
jgi:hypothetical protein